MFGNTLVLHRETVEGPTDADRGMVLQILDDVLATAIVRVLRYKRQESMAKDLHAGFVAFEFQKLGQDAQVHVDRIAERITQLAGEPDFTPVGHLMGSHSEIEILEGSSLQEVIKEGWVAERAAMDFYRALIRVVMDKDPATHRILENILVSEQEHADTLINLFTSFDLRKSA